ncbi:MULTISPECIES: GntR family transcriptional regulator [Agrobacterium]|nr:MULTISPECIES: GntR family transcriptional regulator [Agrobacterium]OCJ44940.1 hypothetical protein A6U92_17120 [Agrobacterium rubi]
MIEDGEFAPARPYRIVHAVLKAHIEEGRLPEGLVLLEGPLANLFGVSRAPIAKALQILHEESIIDRFEGRGFIVPSSSTDKPIPLRIDLKEAGLVLNQGADDAIQSRGTWEHLFSEIENAAAEAMAFGRFRFIETEMADHFNVSRTVVRDVLGRLQESGLVAKDPRSHWAVGPLTAETLIEYYDMRELIEPAALRIASTIVDPLELQQKHSRINTALDNFPNLTPQEISSLEDDLHVGLLQIVPNGQLKTTLKRSQVPLITKRMFNHYLGIPGNDRDLREHKMIFELLLDNAVDAAALMLSTHLKHAKERSLSRLKLLTVVSNPDIAPYLKPLD